MAKKSKKSKNNKLSNFSKTTKIVSCFLFVVGAICGVATTYFITKNDTFSLIGETEIVLTVGQAYIEQGAKAIAFGKDISSQIVPTGTVNTDVADDYVIKYTVDNFRFKNYTLYRKVTVKEV